MLGGPGLPSVMRRKVSASSAPSSSSSSGASASTAEPARSLDAIHHAGDILEAAKTLGLDVVRDTSLLWIAEELWLAPLPDGWHECVDEEGRLYYANAIAGADDGALDANDDADGEGLVKWSHPLEDYYRGLVLMRKGCQSKVTQFAHAHIARSCDRPSRAPT